MPKNSLASVFRRSTRYLFYKLVPPQKIYECSLLSARFFSQLNINIFYLFFGFKIHNPYPLANITEVYLEKILSTLYTNCTRKLNIKVKIQGLESVLKIYREHNKLIICSVHLPLNNAILHCLYSSKISYSLIGTIQPNPWDIAEPRFSVLKPSSHVLVSAKNQLVSGKAVLCLIDKYFNSDAIILSPNLFKFAQISKTPLIFFNSKLLDSGEILVNFHCPRKPLLLSNADFENCKNEFVNFLSILRYKKIPIYFD